MAKGGSRRRALEEGGGNVMRRIPTVMTIAGSDSGAGAGIQADLKTFAALGVYGTSVITAITAQNTLRVTGIQEITLDLVAAQMDAVVSDIGADAVKTGMLSSAPIIQAVVEGIRRHNLTNLVVDPVMVAKGGDRLLREDAVEALRTLLLPLAAVVTPNVPEAEVLAGGRIISKMDVQEAARSIVALGARSVVVKGGHLEGPAVDTFYDGQHMREFTTPRVGTRNTHGTGCTFASAIAAGLARGLAVEEAVGRAKEYVTETLQRAFPMGQGHGPLNHFYRLWEQE